VAALLLWLVLLAGAGPWLQGLQDRVGDWAWTLGAGRGDERRLIVIDIDERSLAETGPWPWPRATQARLLDQLAQAGAGLQILDIVFTTPQPQDATLAQALARHRPVLAQAFALQAGTNPTVGQPTGALDWPTCPAPFAQASGHLGNDPGLLAPGLRAGHITPRVDADGIVRHQPAIICHHQRAWPALGIAALMQGSAEAQLTLARGGWLEAPWQLTAPGLGRIPLDDAGNLRISWRLHPEQFISLSAADVLAGRIPAGLLQGAWVLVGSSAFGLNDTIATPYAAAASGLQAHAQIITALVDGRTPYTPRYAPWLQALLAALGLAHMAWLARSRPQPAPGQARHGTRPILVYLLPLVALAQALLLLALHSLLQLHAALWLGWAAPALLLLTAGLVLAMLAHAQTRLDRDRIYAHLASYLPAPVAAALALQPPSSAIQAATRQVSVLVADIRNFSAYCEARPPEEAAAVLHAFFSEATRIIQAHGGVIEAFQGDAVLAAWNAELQQADTASAASHASLALRAATELLAASRKVLPDPAPAGLEPLSLGVGVETGPAMAGSFGLASRRTHMVMGRTVTIASRLVEMTADLAHPILVGEGLAGQIGGAGLQSMGTFLLDGLRVPHHIYAYPLEAALRPA
jgi:adenylate cyclase